MTCLLATEYIWTCDGRGCGSRLLVRSTIRLPAGWVERQVFHGPELHHVDHLCQNCSGTRGATPESEPLK